MDTQAYRVAVMLTINDQLSRQMAIISKDANQLYLRFNKINDQLKSIANSANTAASSIARMNKAMNSNGISSSSRDANNFASAMKRAADSAQVISRASSVAPAAIPLAVMASSGAMALASGGGRGGIPPGSPLLLSGPGGGRSPGGFSALNGWRNGVPPGGWGGGNPPGGGGSGYGGGNGSHADGIANMAIAYGGFSFMKSAVDAGAEYQTMVQKFKQFGMGDAAVSEAEKFAKGTQIVGSSTIDILRYFTEAQGVFREAGASTLEEQLKGARLAAPVMAKMQLAMQGLDEHARAMTSAKQMDMLRFVEQAGGLQSADRFNRLMDMGFKAVQSSGGNIDFTQMRQFMAKAGTSAFGLSEKALFAGLEPIIGELKGSSAGDALMTAYNRLNGIVKIPNQVVHDLEKMGVWDSSKIEHNSLGGIKRFNGNPLVNSALFAQDPVEYYRKMILPIYKNRNMSEDEIQRSNALIFGRTGGKMFNLIDKQMKVIEHSLIAFDKARGLDESYGAVTGTYAGKQVDFEAKWKNFQLALAQDGGLLDTFTKGLQGLTTFLQKMTEFSNNNPRFTSTAVTLLELVTALAAFKGGLWLTKHAISALFTPISILNGSSGISLLTTRLGALGGAVSGVSIATAAAAAYVMAIAGNEVVERWKAMKEGRPYDQIIGQSAEMSDLERLQRKNWEKNHPGEPFPGSWSSSVNSGKYPEAKNPLQTVQVNSSVYLDGRKVGDAITQHIVKQGSKPPSGVSGVDTTMNLIHAGMGSLVTR
ncbi:hypothetical protein V7I42_00260 [Raoultella ornithinolytica]|uniref:hypothetical protein n=1 Tax=Raoultella ornithinolytica TaxID=54291 RepID=UPI002FF2D991